MAWAPRRHGRSAQQQSSPQSGGQSASSQHDRGSTSSSRIRLTSSLWVGTRCPTLGRDIRGGDGALRGGLSGDALRLRST